MDFQYHLNAFPRSRKEGKKEKIAAALRSAAVKIASKPKPESAYPSSFRLPKSLTAPHILRSPIVTSFCVESIRPMHSATASVLPVSHGSYSWIVEDSLQSSHSRKMGKSQFSRMSPLHFHYEDVLRQDMLLKLNCACIMLVPGLCEIRLVPKASASSGFTMKSGKLAIEILCGQRFIKAKRGPYFQAGKSSRSYSFMGSEKDTGFARQSAFQGDEMSNFLVRILTVMPMLYSPVKIRENSDQILNGNIVLPILPRTRRSFRVLRAFDVTIATSANAKEETLLLWSGFLLNDEVETK